MFRLKSLFVFVSLLSAIEFSSVGWAQTNSGQLVVRDSRTNEWSQLEIARYHVNVVLQAPVALVQIDQSFFNRGGSSSEGTYVFNLPRGASVSRFAMYVTHGELIEGELIDRTKAARVYNSIVSKRRDPAILEQIGDNLFRMRVFPIFARDTKRILLDFTVPMEETDDRFHFELPLLSDKRPVWDFKLQGTVSSPVDLESVTSRSHPELQIQKSTELDDVKFHFHQQHEMAPPKFDLSFQSPDKLAPNMQAYVMGEGFGRRMYFMATLPSDELQRQAAQPNKPVDVLLLVDTSSSSGNLEDHREAVRLISDQLRETDRMQLGCLDVDLRMLTDDWLMSQSPEVEGALTQLDKEFALGPSELSLSISQALRYVSQGRDTSRDLHIVYVGDGVNSGVGDKGAWLAPFAQSMLAEKVTFSAVVTQAPLDIIQYDVEIPLAQTGGRMFKWTSTITESTLSTWVSSGFPLTVTVDKVELFEGEPAEFKSQRPDILHDPYWIPGQSFYIYGAALPHEQVQLKVSVGGIERELRFQVDQQTEGTSAVFTGRLWAQRKLESMPDTSGKAAREKAVELAQKWSLMTRDTAFLVLESEKDYERWGIDRKVRQRYWKPSDAVVSIPYPDDVLQLLKTPKAEADPEANPSPAFEKAKSSEKYSDEQVERLLKSARKALSENEPALAQRYLLTVLNSPHVEHQQMANEILKDVSQRLNSIKSLSDRGLQRGQFDLSHQVELPTGEFFPFLLGAGGTSQQFRDWHPFADKLVQRIQPPQASVSLKTLVRFIEQSTHLPVLIDHPRLSEVGIGENDEINLEGIKNISLRNLLYHSLREVDGIQATYLIDPHYVLITSQSDAEERLNTVNYPVVDLIRTDQLPHPGLLSNPYRDAEEAFERRLNAKMQQLVSIDRDEMPLGEFADWLREKLDMNLTLDLTTLSQSGVGPKEKVTLPLLQNVPLETVVRLTMEDVGGVECRLLVDREVAQITTVEDEEERMLTKLYSGVGVVFDLPSALLSHQVRPKHTTFGGSFGGGMGGGGFFGGGQSVGGQFGGGGFTGLGNGTDEPAYQSTEGPAVSSVGAPSTAQPPEKSETDIDEPIVDSMVPLSPTFAGDAYDQISLIQHETAGPWFTIDGLGGTIDYFETGNLFVIRQTGKNQREIQELLSKLRSLPVSGQRVKHRRIPLVTEDMVHGWDADSLIEIIQSQTAGPWFDIDGLGGTVDPHYPSMSLFIRQTHSVHEEVFGLLTDLRRGMLLNRYQLQLLDHGLPLPDNLQWGANLTLTALPRLISPPATGATVEELALLDVRTAAPATQSWKRLGTSATEFEIEWSENRLQLEVNDITARAEEELATIFYPSLSVAEHGNWGEAVRRIADSLLPWQPHRSNAELAAMFEVSLVKETEETRTLLLQHYHVEDVAQKITYSKIQPGRLVSWKAMLAGKVVFELRVSVEDEQAVVIALNPKGDTLAKWIGEEYESKSDISPLNIVNAETLFIDQTTGQGNLLHSLRKELEIFNYPAAIKLLEEQLQKTPQQPLLNFLLAWCCKHDAGQMPNQASRMQQAISNVLNSEADQLIHLITTLNFNGLTESKLLEMLVANPWDQRSIRVLDTIATLSQNQKQPQQALQILDKILSDTSQRTDQRLLKSIELLLELEDIKIAEQRAEEVLMKHQEDPKSVLALVYANLGDRFGRYSNQKSHQYFQQALDLTTSANDRYEMLLRHSMWLSGDARIRYLAQAAELHSSRDPLEIPPLQMLLKAAQTHQDSELLAELASLTKKENVQYELQIRQAELMADRIEAAKLVRELYEGNNITHGEQIALIENRDRQYALEQREAWALSTMVQGGEQDYVIKDLEARLHQGQRLTEEFQTTLANAYTSAGQSKKAIRARTAKHEF